MIPNRSHSFQEGQGLVEYALILVLVAVVVIVVLALLGPAVGNVFSNVVSGLENVASPTDTPVPTDVVAVSLLECYPASGHFRVHIDATSDGGYDPGVTLTTSPGGVMILGHTPPPDHYHIMFDVAACTGTVTISSSAGGSTTVSLSP